MIPPFQGTGNLPPGIHVATWQEFTERFGWNTYRRRLLSGMRMALNSLAHAGCRRVYLNGSFATRKYRPRDFDGCWDSRNVDWARLDPELRTFQDRRAAQKRRYGGELFPADFIARPPHTTYLQFFQIDKDGNPKGIVSVDPGVV